MGQKQSSIPTIAEYGDDRIIELKIRTTPVGILPMEFKSFYIRVAKEIPDEIVREMLDEEIGRLTNSMQNWADWENFVAERRAYV